MLCLFTKCARVKSRYIGDGRPPTFNRESLQWVYKPLLLGWWPSPIIWKKWEFRPWHKCLLVRVSLLEIRKLVNWLALWLGFGTAGTKWARWCLHARGSSFWPPAVCLQQKTQTKNNQKFYTVCLPTLRFWMNLAALPSAHVWFLNCFASMKPGITYSMIA